MADEENQSQQPEAQQPEVVAKQETPAAAPAEETPEAKDETKAVSYTHLTLPTILLV